MGNIRDYDTFEELWFSEQANKERDLVRTCHKNCWMVGTAAPVMKKYIKHPLAWALKNKTKNMLGIKVDRSCVPGHFDVGQDPLQGDLRGGESVTSKAIDDGFTGETDNRLMTHELSNQKITDNIFLLEVARNEFAYTPGQNVSIGPGLQYHKSRDYTFYSAPTEDTLKFSVREVQQREISPTLKFLQKGDKVDVVGPYGEFELQNPTDQKQKHLFIASGVGIDPFRSIITQYPDVNYTILHGIRHSLELAMAQGLDKEKYIPCVTADDGGSFKGRVTDYLNDLEIEDGTYCYICGNPHMLRSAYDLLVAKGVSEDFILTEPYYAY